MSFGWNVDKTPNYRAFDNSNQVIPLTGAEIVKDLWYGLMKIYLLRPHAS